MMGPIVDSRGDPEVHIYQKMPIPVLCGELVYAYAYVFNLLFTMLSPYRT